MNTGGVYDSSVNLNKGLQTLWNAATSVYEIDILTLCAVNCLPM